MFRAGSGSVFGWFGVTLGFLGLSWGSFRALFGSALLSCVLSERSLEETEESGVRAAALQYSARYQEFA